MDLDCWEFVQEWGYLHSLGYIDPESMAKRSLDFRITVYDDPEESLYVWLSSPGHIDQDGVQHQWTRNLGQLGPYYMHQHIDLDSGSGWWLFSPGHIDLDVVRPQWTQIPVHKWPRMGQCIDDPALRVTSTQRQCGPNGSGFWVRINLFSPKIICNFSISYEFPSLKSKGFVIKLKSHSN